MKGAKVPNIQSEGYAASASTAYQNKQIERLSTGPLASGTVLTSISLTTGSNTISHKLQAKLQGWLIVRQRSAATIYDEQDGNASAEQTLKLNSSGATVVDIFVF